jgi:chromate transporter
LFLTFTLIALQSFGGALVIIERTVVDRKRWYDEREFVGIYAISQVLPGPTGIALCVLMGDHFFGIRGAAAALAGFILIPSLIVLGIAVVFEQFVHVPWVQGALQGMGAASIGIVLLLAWRLSRTLYGNRIGVIVAALSFVAVALGHWPVGTVVLSIGVGSVWLAWRRAGPASGGPSSGGPASGGPASGGPAQDSGPSAPGGA